MTFIRNGHDFLAEKIKNECKFFFFLIRGRNQINHAFGVMDEIHSMLPWLSKSLITEASCVSHPSRQKRDWFAISSTILAMYDIHQVLGLIKIACTSFMSGRNRIHHAFDVLDDIHLMLGQEPPTSHGRIDGPSRECHAARLQCV